MAFPFTNLEFRLFQYPSVGSLIATGDSASGLDFCLSQPEFANFSNKNKNSNYNKVTMANSTMTIISWMVGGIQDQTQVCSFSFAHAPLFLSLPRSLKHRQHRQHRPHRPERRHAIGRKRLS